MTPEEFVKQLYDNADDSWRDDIFPPPTEAQHGLNILIHHFLGDDWYSMNPIHTEQINSEAICEILKRYPKKKLFSILEYLKFRKGK